MQFHYASGAMGYAGEGWFWHKFFNFPELPFTTKTITLYPKKGLPWAVLPVGGSVFNKVGLHNCGLVEWRAKYYPNIKNGCTLSISAHEYLTTWEVYINTYFTEVEAIELNYSCPNVKGHYDMVIPNTYKPVWLKLNHTQDPYDYDLDKVTGIRLNSLPLGFCGGSGKIAQKKNWEFIKRYNKEGLNVSGCSFQSLDDVKRLEDMGCKEVSIGSTIITNPRLIERITDYGGLTEW